jgi:uncharacterized protein (DUF433 family)
MNRRQIVCTPGTCGGAPRIEGTRIACGNVVNQIKRMNVSVSKWLELYPYLTIHDLKECLLYCSSQKCLVDSPENYCTGCIHDCREEEVPEAFISLPSDLVEVGKSVGEGGAFAGTISEYLDTRGGAEYWKMAKEILEGMGSEKP